MPTNVPSRARRRAFTLIEAIAVIVVLGVLGSVVSQLVYRASTLYTDSALRAQLVADLNSAMDRIDKELRQIPLKSPYSGVAPNITSVTATSIAWVDTAGAARALTLTGTTLTLTDTSGTFTLLSNCSGLTIACADAAGAALSATLSGTGCDSVRRISVTLSGSRAGSSDTLRSKIFLRSTLQGGSP